VRKGTKSLMSTSIPAENIGAIQSFIEHEFSYREGFINMIASTSNKQLQWKRLVSNDIKTIEIRMALKQDIIKIEEWYSKSQFPSRFVTEEHFDSSKAMMLYGKRFREVMESDEIDGDVIVLYADGHQAGAIIQAIDSRLFESRGIKTNLLSGMGLIVNPQYRRMGIGSALVAYRQEQYGKIGVEWVNLGANLNNRIMVQCLEELNFKYGSTDISLARWF
jgi:ribosomal protein S18 acetylase RimI-like enzyme